MGRTLHEEEDDEELDLSLETNEERSVLERLIARLERIEHDPKLNVVRHYLEGEKWLDHGVIIFSQYFDTAKWVADALAARYPDEAIGLYAGAGRSRLYQQGDSVYSQRETLKKMVAEHEIRLMVAPMPLVRGLTCKLSAPLSISTSLGTLPGFNNA